MVKIEDITYSWKDDRNVERDDEPFLLTLRFSKNKQTSSLDTQIVVYQNSLLVVGREQTRGNQSPTRWVNRFELYIIPITIDYSTFLLCLVLFSGGTRTRVKVASRLSSSTFRAQYSIILFRKQDPPVIVDLNITKYARYVSPRLALNLHAEKLFQNYFLSRFHVTRAQRRRRIG